MRKFILLLIIGAVLTSWVVLPRHVAKAGDGGAGYVLVVKEYGLDTIANALAKELLATILDNMAEQISKGGFGGGPAWVELWDIYARNSQDTGRSFAQQELFEALFDEDLGTICPHQIGILDAVFDPIPPEAPGINADKRIGNLLSFRQRVRCTLPETLLVGAEIVPFDQKAIDDFQFDFRNGGWDAFSALRKNRVSKTYFAMLLEDDAQTKRAEQDAIREVTANSGFEGQRDEFGKIVTPGSILDRAAFAVIEKELDSLVVADELEEVVFAAGRLLIRRLVDYGGSNEALAEDPSLRERVVYDRDRQPAIDFCTQIADARCDSLRTESSSSCSDSETSTTGNYNEDTGGFNSTTTSSEGTCDIAEDLAQKYICMEAAIPPCLIDINQYDPSTEDIVVICGLGGIEKCSVSVFDR